MTRIKVRAQTFTDDTHEGLVGRIESVVEALRNRGDRIVAILPSPNAFKETGWTATVFHEWEVEQK